VTTLWDTTGSAVVKELAAQRRTGGAVLSGVALTLVVVADEGRVAEAEEAATAAAEQHPCRLLIVVRRQIEAPTPRLDAEVLIGGRLGPGEAVVMRMYGRLALHAESVVLPLLAADAPVVTWWHGAPPDQLCTDALAVIADRRITDSAQTDDPMKTLRTRAEDYAPGDTDLAWTRITPWRTLVAGAFDSTVAAVTDATVVAPAKDPTAALMSGWLASRLGIAPTLSPTDQWPRMRSVALRCANGDELSIVRDDGTAQFRRSGQDERTMPLTRRPLGDELAEELRRLDSDEIYAEALGAATGYSGLAARTGRRVHVWKDPATAERAEAGISAHSGTSTHA
jgi:glucose-6-phosphate dehydrogenase assembly protein OpcA